MKKTKIVKFRIRTRALFLVRAEVRTKILYLPEKLSSMAFVITCIRGTENQRMCLRMTDT